MWWTPARYECSPLLLAHQQLCRAIPLLTWIGGSSLVGLNRLSELRCCMLQHHRCPLSPHLRQLRQRVAARKYQRLPSAQLLQLQWHAQRLPRHRLPPRWALKALLRALPLAAVAACMRCSPSAVASRACDRLARTYGLPARALCLVICCHHKIAVPVNMMTTARMVAEVSHTQSLVVAAAALRQPANRTRRTLRTVRDRGRQGCVDPARAQPMLLLLLRAATLLARGQWAHWICSGAQGPRAAATAATRQRICPVATSLTLKILKSAPIPNTCVNRCTQRAMPC